MKSRKGPSRGDHAVVIGGSMAGMLAARVLADHFHKVTVVERDRLPDQAEPRRGTPQARHLHVLLERGRQIIEHLFPGLGAAMVAEGATLVDSAADLALLNSAGWAVQFPSGIVMLACSRDLLDWHVRRRLRAIPNVEILSETNVTRLLSDASGREIHGVELRPRSGPPAEDSPEIALPADLVVDASGRGSRTPEWLESLGYSRPEETVVDAHLGYASRLYRRPKQLPAGQKGIFIQATPPSCTRAGVAFPIEGDRWIVTVSGGDHDYPPTDEQGFLGFVRSLRSPLIYDAIEHAEPLSPIFGFRGMENRQRHYERLKRWPERFLVMGDATRAFNPVYAQGMTTAALSAVTLDACLKRQRLAGGTANLAGLGRRFQKQLARVSATPWLLSTSDDMRYLRTDGTLPGWTSRFVHRYMDRVLHLITHSTAVRNRSLRVFHMVRSPLSLFHPALVSRVLWQWATQASYELDPAGLLPATRRPL